MMLMMMMMMIMMIRVLGTIYDDHNDDANGNAVNS